MSTPNSFFIAHTCGSTVGPTSGPGHARTCIGETALDVRQYSCSVTLRGGRATGKCRRRDGWISQLAPSLRRLHCTPSKRRRNHHRDRSTHARGKLPCFLDALSAVPARGACARICSRVLFLSSISLFLQYFVAKTGIYALVYTYVFPRGSSVRLLLDT
jgi:hypothetical protein